MMMPPTLFTVETQVQAELKGLRGGAALQTRRRRWDEQAASGESDLRDAVGRAR